MVGGESRKSRKPCATTKSSALTQSRRTSSRRPRAPSKNTNLKGLISFILHNVSNIVTCWGKYLTVVALRTITSSENTGDMIVENISMTKANRGSAGRGLATQSSTCRDWRTLRRDRLYNSAPIRHQLKFADKPTQKYLPPKR